MPSVPAPPRWEARMHANEAFDSIATPIRGAERGLLPGAVVGQCDGARRKVDHCPEHAAVHAAGPKTLMHFPGP
jgi:hypothetical protein